LTTAIDAYAFGNCTYYVAERFPKIYPYLGNAAGWIGTAQQQGYPILLTPAPDTVAVYGASPTSPLGHVAVVDSVNADGSFVVSEMNNPYTPGGGYDHVDTRVDPNTSGIVGFVVPPGSTYKAAASTTTAPTACVVGSITIPAVPFSGGSPTVICFDGLMGVSAMVAGGLLMVAGLAIFAAFALKDTGVGRAATQAVGVVGGPVGAVVAASARSNAPRPEKSTPETEADAAAASTARVATARSRVRTPEAESAVAEARAGRGKKLTPEVSKELRSEAA
jgi:surface antigen